MHRFELTDVVDLIYAAALGEGASWQDLGDRLMTLMGAQRATLWLTDEFGATGNLLMRADAYDEGYASRYVALDPYRAAAAKVGLEETARQKGDIRLGHEIIPDASYVKSEFYTDFGRKSARRYMIGGLIGASKVIPLGLHRDAASRPFADDDKRTLSLLLPHLQRALQMRARLTPTASNFGACALDVLPLGVIIVDQERRLLYCNAEAAALFGDRQSGLFVARHARGVGAGVSRLVARHPEDDARLCRLVSASSQGGAGGGMQIRARPGALAGASTTLSALICPALRHLSSPGRPNIGTSVFHGAATVLVRRLLAPSTPPVGLLIDLFGLTRSEAEVAVALAGGVTAEEAARGRHVSLDTVRSQIRAILQKTGASGLRDFERIIALISTMHTDRAENHILTEGKLRQITPD
ncbi:LuxR family transcriptional regulator [Caballeronia pedi]|uniref:LuxR family transcriptional regulator n=1 Tax=Caballeronia pedi TaxID=1777141 RepID=A0A158BDH1_9BURK|nr:helix-turn-helix transcriptional regulator [Caballeronia pedi]SAK67856.1 LuxR family transcriptional regulator [Caballeronia pedi]